MKEDLTNKVCPRCHEVLDECLCEEQKVKDWEDAHDQQPQPQ